MALACHGQAAVEGSPFSSFFRDNSTCRFCDSVRFVGLRRRLFRAQPEEVPLAADPAAWFAYLRASGARTLTLRWAREDRDGLSDRMSAGFVGGGGQWTLGVTTARGAEAYRPGWTVWNQQAPDRRIWRVVYTRLPAPSPPPGGPAHEVAAVTAELADALRAIEAFARPRNLTGFAEAFTTALRCLEADRPFDLVYHRDLAPAGVLDLGEARLLAAAQAAWVFGGMGSWNDLAFDAADTPPYESLSDRLFDVVNRAVCAGASGPARRRAS